MKLIKILLVVLFILVAAIAIGVIQDHFNDPFRGCHVTERNQGEDHNYTWYKCDDGRVFYTHP